MTRTLKWLISTVLAVLLLLDWPIFSAYAEHAKTDREWRIGKLRQLRSEAKYADATENLRISDPSKMDAAVHAVKRSLGFSGPDLRIRFRSSDAPDSVGAKLSEFDSAVTVKKLAGDAYEVSVPKDSDLATEYLSQAADGKLPEMLPGGYTVVFPKPLEALSSTGFLSGERTDELWGQSYVRADAVQEALAELPEIKIGVIDSGVDASHPDLVGRVDSADGYDFVENDSDPQDGNGHGTFVSGIIAGAVNGSGIYGVDSNAKIVPLKALDADGMGTTYDLADAIAFAVSKGVKVVNISLGGYGDPATDPVCQTVSAAKTAGTVVIAAAGNSNSDVSNVVPAGCADVIAVGAVGKDGAKAPFSNYGQKIAVSAPGVDILSAWKGGGYEIHGGTSASSAFVAGAVGALLAKDASKTPDAVMAALKSGSGGLLDLEDLLSVPLTTVAPPSVPNATATGTVAEWTETVTWNTWSAVSWTGVSHAWPPVDPASSWPYYSGFFLYDGVWYGNAYYSQTFPDDVLNRYGVVRLDKKPESASGIVSAMSAPTNWLVGEWLLDGNANDTSGNGGNGSPVNVAWVDSTLTPGKKAAHFDGVSSYVWLPQNQNTFFYNDYSISAWAQRDPSNEWGLMLYQMGNAGLHYGFSHSFDAPTWNDGLLIDPSIPFDGQYHLYTYTKSSTSGTKLYRDGVLVASDNNLAWATPWYSNVVIGAFLWPGNEYFKGNIQSVRIYNRVISDSEAFDLYKEQVPYATLSWPIGEWKLDGSGIDSSGNGNNGSANNVTWTADRFWAVNRAAHFSGGSFIDIWDSDILRPKLLSVSVWLRPEEPNGTIVGKSAWNNAQNEQYALTLYQNKPIFHIKRNSGCTPWVGWYSVMSSDEIIPSDWSHVVGTFDWSTIRMFVNWVQKWSANVPSWYLDNCVGGNLRIASWWSWDPVYYKGDVDDIRMYDRPLSSSEIDSQYQEGSSATDTSSTRPSPQLSPAELDWYAGATSTKARFNEALLSGNFQTSPAAGDASRNHASNVGDPVTLSTGEFEYSNTFLKAKEGSMPYEFSLKYRNQMPYDGPVGQKFDHNYNVFLAENADGSVNFYNGKLGIFNFAATETGFVRNDGLRAELAKDTAWRYFIAFGDGSRYEFWPNLKVSKMSDRYGNSLTFGYFSNEALATVNDSLGRTVDYEYGADTRLSKVTDWLGRTVELEYFPNGDLKSVTLESGTESKTVSFTYAGSTHNVATLVDSKGQTYVSNLYDANGRVTSQTYGNGTITYAYELSGNRVASNAVTNAEGVVTKYSYDPNGNVTERRVYDRTGGGSTVYRYEYYPDARLAKSVMPNGNGTTYLYDVRGNVVEKRDKADADAPDSPQDLVTTVQYDGTFDVPVRSVSAAGIETVATLDGSGNVLARTVSGILNPDGTTYSSTASYEYDAAGRVVKSTDPAWRETLYAYSGGLLISVMKGTGTGAVVETFAYGTDGNPVSSSDGESKTKTFEYDAFGQPSKIVSAEGIETRFQYDANGNKTREETYSSTGILASRTDYEYDALDKPVTKTVKTGADSSISAHTAYDANGNVVSERIGANAETRAAYDELGRPKSKRVIADPNDPSKDIVTSYSYDRNGNLLSVTDPLGNVTSYVYDGYDRKIRMTDPLGITTNWTYDKSGNPTYEVVASSSGVPAKRMWNTYDALGRAVKTFVRYGSWTVTVPTPANSTFTTVKYAPDGNLLETTDPMGYATRYGYDSIGRKISVTDPLGNRAETSYDKRGLVTETRLIGSGSELAVTTQYGYDSDGRKISDKSVTATGTFDTSYSYGGLPTPTSVTDPDGNRTDYTYDYLGRKLSETKYLTDGTPVVVSYSYDGTGNLSSVTDAEGRATLYSYDSLGRNVRVTYPDGTHKDFWYDKAGNRMEEILARGVTVSTSYDALGRLTSLSASGVALAVSELETYSYDPIGRLLSVSSSGNALSFKYGSTVRMISETQNGTTVSYSYSKNGHPISIATPGYLATYFRDPLGRITSASLDGTGMLTRSYSGTFLASDSYWNGTSTSYSYDELGRLTSLSRPDLPSVSREYGYSPAGNVTSDGLRAYSYDPLSRLVSAGVLPDSAHPAGAELFSYGLTGNRISSEFTGTSASYSGNLLDQYVSKTTWTGTEIYSYDADGNLSSDGRFLYSYDSKNRLVGVSGPDGAFVASYSYDPLGRRVSKTTVEGKTEYLYSGENAITETFSPLSGPVRKASYLYGDSPDELLAYSADVSALAPELAPERLFCALRVSPYGTDFSSYGWTDVVSRCSGLELLASQTVRKSFAVLTDRLGSPAALTDGSGALTAEYAQSAFGETYVRSGTGEFRPASAYGTALPNGLSRLFAGREYDAETGLYYNRARTYSPQLGRFLQRDPVGQTDQINLYTYVANNPLGFTDPTGEVIETGWDVAHVYYDIERGKRDISKLAYWAAKFGYASYKDDSCMKKSVVRSMKRDLDDLGEVATDAVFDSAAAVTPFVPAGTTKAVRFIRKAEKTYQTYTKYNQQTGETYVGRTSGYGSPKENVYARDLNHHMNEKWFGPAQLDKTSVEPKAIRAREQQMIEHYGWAKSSGWNSGNSINWISPLNPKRESYFDAMRNLFN